MTSDRLITMVIEGIYLVATTPLAFNLTKLLIKYFNNDHCDSEFDEAALVLLIILTLYIYCIWDIVDKLI